MQYHHHNGRAPCHPAGESRTPYLRVDFDRRLKLEFHGSKVTSDAGLLAYRELDDALGLTEVAEGLFQDSRTGKNGRHGMVWQFRQSLFGCLGGFDDLGCHHNRKADAYHIQRGSLVRQQFRSKADALKLLRNANPMLASPPSAIAPISGKPRIIDGDTLQISNTKMVLPGKSRGTFDNVILSGGPYDPICTTTIHG